MIVFSDLFSHFRRMLLDKFLHLVASLAVIAGVDSSLNQSLQLSLYLREVVANSSFCTVRYSSNFHAIPT